MSVESQRYCPGLSLILKQILTLHSYRWGLAFPQYVLVAMLLDPSHRVGDQTKQ